MVERAPVGTPGDGVGALPPMRGQARRLTVSGVDLELYEGGEGPPLLWLHGFLELPGWSEPHELLAQRYHVLAPSLPGYAGSARPAWLESIEDLAYLGLDLVDALGLDDVRLVGHSLGGWIAAEMAVRCSHRLRKLVLVDAVGVRCGGPVARAGGFITDWLALAPEQVRPLRVARLGDGPSAQAAGRSRDDAGGANRDHRGPRGGNRLRLEAVLLQPAAAAVAAPHPGPHAGRLGRA